MILKKDCFRQEVTRSEHPHRPGKPRRDRRPRAEARQSDGRELNFSYWYNGNWLGILRFKDPAMSERAAQACEDGVRNRNIGYDMDGRNTAYAAAEAVDFALGKINKPVETDCSAFMMLCAISAGAKELKKLFRRQGNSCTTYCMLHDWPTTGSSRC